MSQITSWTAVETVTRLKARDVSAEEVCLSHLARLDAVNPGLNAVIDRVEDALEQARAIDRNAAPPGPLYGAPVTTKVNTDQSGTANTNGLPGFAQNIALHDSAVVANMRAAGAVIIGRTNTPEVSLRWCTSNPLHGVTLNPWNPEVTPGGSSGGAVAAGIGVIAQGNDLGGSVRYPAYCCGIAGLRPSLGRIPAVNPSGPAARPPMTAAMSVQGPIARTVADVALGLEAMRGFSADDPLWTGADRNGRPRRDGPLRVGYAPDPFGSGTDPAVADAMTRARDAAISAGMTVQDVTLPEVHRVAELWGRLLFTETRMLSGQMIEDEGSDALKRWINAFVDHFPLLDLEGYVQGQMERSVLQRAWARMFADLDLILMPTSLLPPFENDLDFKAPDRAVEIMDAQRPLCVINVMGLPALALPTHVADGLPLGVQLVGPMHDDAAVLAAGLVLERELGTLLDQMPTPFRP